MLITESHLSAHGAGSLLYQTASVYVQPIGIFLLLFLNAFAFLLVKHFIISSQPCEVTGVIQLLCELV